MNYLDELERLNNLKKDGAISQEEFDTMKMELTQKKEDTHSITNDSPKDSDDTQITEELANEVSTKRKFTFQKLDIIWVIMLSVFIGSHINNIWAFVFILFPILIVPYLILKSIPYRFGLATRKTFSIVLILIFAYLLVAELGNTNPFVSRSTAIVHYIEREGNDYCECVDEAKININRNKQSEDFFRCIELYTITGGEINEKIKDSDLNSQQESQVRNAYERYKRKTDSCVL